MTIPGSPRSRTTCCRSTEVLRRVTSGHGQEPIRAERVSRRYRRGRKRSINANFQLSDLFGKALFRQHDLPLRGDGRLRSGPSSDAHETGRLSQSAEIGCDWIAEGSSYCRTCAMTVTAADPARPKRGA